MTARRPRWERVVLKLSGEALGAPGTTQYSDVLHRLATQIKDVRDHLDIDIAVVVGGGNIWRGIEGAAGGQIDRAQSDYIGMLGTVMNALALQSACEQLGQATRVQTAIEMAEVAEPYIHRRALRHFEKGRVVIFGAGTGNPFFSTDTAAALRAAEVGAGAILRGTHSGVQGVYTDDPRTNPDAELLSEVTFREVLARGLKAMDTAAIAVCQDNDIPIVVFDLLTDGNIRRILEGEPLGTLVT